MKNIYEKSEGGSDTSVKHYLGALKTISEYLIQKGKLKKSLYEIRDIEELEETRVFLSGDEKFVAIDEKRTSNV